MNHVGEAECTKDEWTAETKKRCRDGFREEYRAFVNILEAAGPEYKDRVHHADERKPQNEV